MQEHGYAHLDAIPRGGPESGWLDRKLQTRRLEYLDREDVRPAVKQEIISWMERIGRWQRNHERLASIALAAVSDRLSPRILELGAGHGAVSAQILAQNTAATVTVTDLDGSAVMRMRHTALGSDPRCTIRQMDATRIDADDATFDLALCCQSFHHFTPRQAASLLNEGTRVAQRLVIADLVRFPPPLQLVQLASFVPISAISWRFAHDAAISALRAYSPSAITAIARHCDPSVTVQFHRQFGYQIAVAGQTNRTPGTHQATVT